MNRRQWLRTAGFGAIGAVGAFHVTAAPVRGVKVVVASSADASIQEAAAQIIAAAPRHALLQAMAAAPVLTDSTKLIAAGAPERAYSHLILVGLPDDPMIRAAWQREAKQEPGGLYIFGFGHLRGDLGYIESDRNAFLHGTAIAFAPFETEVVTITGSTTAGVVLASRAFLEWEMVNGVIAKPGWTRGGKTLLDRDPLPPGFEPPLWLPAKAGNFTRVGLTQGAEDEYRGVLADTGTEPMEIWRAKYYRAGCWDGSHLAGAMDAYSNGLHRRAYGNTLWIARFDTAKAAGMAAPRIAEAAKLKPSGGFWAGEQPPYANNTNPGEKASSGPLHLWQREAWVVMSTLPVEVSKLPAE